MNKFPILMLAFVISLTGCSTLDRMNYLVNESTESIQANTNAVAMSTEVIHQNAYVVEASTKTIRENHSLLKANE